MAGGGEKEGEEAPHRNHDHHHHQSINAGEDGARGHFRAPSRDAELGEQTPTPQVPLESLNSTRFTDKIFLILFLLHLLVSFGLMSFTAFKAIHGATENRRSSRTVRRAKRAIHYWLPPIECAAILAVLLALTWLKLMRRWPSFIVAFVPWASFAATMAAGILLLCFSLPETDIAGVALVAFSAGAGIYACWSLRRVPFSSRVVALSLSPASKFPRLNLPIFFLLSGGLVWASLWIFGVIGAAVDFYYPLLTVTYLVLSLAWTAEVARHVANLTVSRAIALYYLRGMQCSTEISFQRAITINLGSACLVSLLMPAIDCMRNLAKVLNLLGGENVFMFSCAHCCLHAMEKVFRYGNTWAFVHIAAYGRGFVAASESSLGLLQRAGMVELVESDMISAVCFLAGVTSGAVCVIFAASWTFSIRRHYAATVSLLAFWIGYLMTRISLSVAESCVACCYVCYAENPSSRLFDSNIPDHLHLLRSGGGGGDALRFTRRRFTPSTPLSQQVEN